MTKLPASRLSGEWGTRLRNDIFRRARLKLTVFYGLSVFLIVIVFSLGIYMFFGADIVGDFEYEGGGGANEQALEQEFVKVAQRRLISTLIAVDLGAALLALAAGWILAGRTLSPIRESLEQHKRFVSDAAHELRTPLSVMKAGLETIDSGTEPVLEDYQELSADLREEIGRVVDLTNDLLFLARGDQGALAAAMSKVDLSRICARQAKLLEPYAGEKGVSLETDITPGLAVMGDEGQISRLVLNLLKNAIDYNRRGGDVHLSLSCEDNKADMTVTDTGMGIGREDLRRVFERFYKADAARERSEGGAGLGLSISWEIVRAYSGEIRIDSSAGEGTSVTVLFDLPDSGG